MTHQETVRAAYDAYNRRDLKAGLARLTPGVRWDDGKGHMVQGLDAVAAHWQEQWRSADARVEIRSIEEKDTSLILSIVLRTQPPGRTVETRELKNHIEFSEGLILSMRIS
jgi:SnoaL-like domain